MDLQLKNKRAVVMGGTRGIGRAIAETLAAEGADVALCARNADQVKEAVAAIKDKGVRAFGASVDISDARALRAWIEKAAGELGGIDILISNAGALAHTNDEDGWEKNLRVDILGPVNAMDVALPHLEKAAEKNGEASVVFISSVSGAISDRPDSYGPVKAALIHLAKGYSRQYGGKHIRVNVVSPGMTYFESGTWGRIKREQPEMFKQAIARTPFNRCGTPEEIASAAVFLASPVSSYTSGVNLMVDGSVVNRVNF